jgi:hypothetical protein
MTAPATAAVIGAALLTLAIWIEIQERRAALGDGNYRSSGNPKVGGSNPPPATNLFNHLHSKVKLRGACRFSLRS